MDEEITASCGNIFLDLGFSEEEAALLTMRAKLMLALRETISERGWTQTEAAEHLGIAQSRISSLVCGKWDKFSLDMLITIASRAGLRTELEIA